MTVSEKSIGGYGLLNENWLFGITNTESKKHRADCFREIGERTFSFFLDTAVEQGFEDREGQWTMSCEIVDAMQKKKPPSLHDKPHKIYPAKTKAKNVSISLPRYHSACRHAAVDLSLATWYNSVYCPEGTFL